MVGGFVAGGTGEEFGVLLLAAGGPYLLDLGLMLSSTRL